MVVPYRFSSSLEVAVNRWKSIRRFRRLVRVCRSASQPLQLFNSSNQTLQPCNSVTLQPNPSTFNVQPSTSRKGGLTPPGRLRYTPALLRTRGGTGRHVRFRFLSQQWGGGSSPLGCTISPNNQATTLRCAPRATRDSKVGIRPCHGWVGACILGGSSDSEVRIYAYNQPTSPQRTDDAP